MLPAMAPPIASFFRWFLGAVGCKAPPLHPFWKGEVSVYENIARRTPTHFDVDGHTGTASDFLERHIAACEAVQRGGTKSTEILPFLLGRIADTRNLGAAFDHLQAHGGDCPGPDGRTYSDYTKAEKWDVVRMLSNTILDGRYRLGPERLVDIPKSSGRAPELSRAERPGPRRTTGRPANLQPWLDPTFDRHSFGGRPQRGATHALAYANVLTKYEGRGIWVCDDIKDAFGRVPHNRLLDVVRKRLSVSTLVDFIEILLQNGRRHGLRQGASLSSLLLNVYLDHVLDRPWRRQYPDFPLIRYVDDVVILCRPENDVVALYGDLKQKLVAAGVPLKGTAHTAIRDLANGQAAQFLGFDITLGKLGLEHRLRLGEAGPAWAAQLRQSLALAMRSRTHRFEPFRQ